MPVQAVHVSVDLYSGRENPAWDLRAADSEEFLRRLEKLPRRTQPLSGPPDGLGYRGLQVAVHSGAITEQYTVAVGSVFVQGHSSGTKQTLKDDGRQLELWLVHTGESSLGPDLAKSLADSIKEQPQR